MRVPERKRTRRQPAILLFLAFFTLAPLSLAFSFSFSEYEAAEQRADAPPAYRLTDLQCPESFTRSKIATMIGERHRDRRYVYGAYWSRMLITEKAVYGSLIDTLNRSFAQLGLTTYTDEEINEQIAREEQEAFLNNDLEAAMTAADRLRADYMLKGVLSTHTQTNKVIGVDEVFVVIDLALYSRDGTLLSTSRVREESFSDAHISATVQDIVGKQSQRIAYELFADHCQGGS